MIEDYSKLDAFLDTYHQIVLSNINSLDDDDSFCDDIDCDECQLKKTRLCDAHKDAEEMVIEYINKYRPELLL